MPLSAFAGRAELRRPTLEQPARAAARRRAAHCLALIAALLTVGAGCREYRPAPPVTIMAPASAARQQSVDQGYDLWRQDPVLVVRAEVMRYGAAQDWEFTAGEPFFNQSLGRWQVEVRVVNPHNRDQHVVFQVSQPARQGQGGIWTVHEAVRSRR